MKIYNYDEFTKEYLNESEAGLDPEATKIAGHDEYLIPANATTTKPPKTKTHEVAIYDNGWQKVADYRGMYKVNNDMQPSLITTIGELEDGYVAATPQQAKKITEDPLYYIISDNKLIPNPDYDTEKLAQAKEEKYKEALTKAYSFVNDGNACFQFDENNSIEATDGNIGKFTAYALGFTAGTLTEVQWTSKEDNVITLNQEDVLRVLTGLGAIQSNVWNVQYISYKTQIEEAQTAADVYNIEINYEV